MARRFMLRAPQPRAKYPSSTRVAVLETLRDASAAPSRLACKSPGFEFKPHASRCRQEPVPQHHERSPDAPSRHRPRSRLWWPALPSGL